MADEEPTGLSMSLDDMIGSQNARREKSGYGKQRRPERREHNNDRFDGNRGRRYDTRQGDGYRGGGPGGYNNQRQPGMDNMDDPNFYKTHQKYYIKDDGILVFKFRSSELVHVTPNGDLTLSSGGHHNGVTLASLNDILNPIGVRVSLANDNDMSGDWRVTDGKALVRFYDGVVLPGKGQMHQNRSEMLKQAFDTRQMMGGSFPHNDRTGASSFRPSMPFVMGGPRGPMGQMPFNPAMAAAMGPYGPMMMMPPQHNTRQYRPRPANNNNNNMNNPRITISNTAGDNESVFTRLGGRGGGEEDWETKRLKNQGRYRPY